MQIHVNGVRIEPTSPVTLSVTNGIFTEINQSYSMSFEVVRSGAVDEALRLDRVPYDMLTGMTTPIPCSVQVNSHQLEGRLSVESVTKTHASVTLYITTVEIPQSVLDMYLCEVVTSPAALIPMGYYSSDIIANGNYRAYATELGSSDTEATLWNWQFLSIQLTTIKNRIETAAGLPSGTIPSLGSQYRMLCNAFYKPVTAPAEAYLDVSINTLGSQVDRYLGQYSTAFDVSYSTLFSHYNITFTAKKNLTSGTIGIFYYYEPGTGSDQLIIEKVINGVTTTIDTATMTAGNHTLLYSVSAMSVGDEIRITKVVADPFSEGWRLAMTMRVTGTYTAATDDYFEPYEGLVHAASDTFRGSQPATPMMQYLSASSRPVFNYFQMRAGLPKMTVREFLSLYLKMLGIGGSFTRQSTRVIGEIEKFEADNDVSPSTGVRFIAAANEFCFYELPGSDQEDIELPLYYPTRTRMYNGVTFVDNCIDVQNFGVISSSADYGEYVDTTKSREGNATIVIATAATLDICLFPCITPSYFADMRDVAGHGTAEVRVTGIPDFVLFPDIIEVNGWVLYVVSTEIDTNSGFYTIKAIIKQ